ncbi:MAG: type IX secretion system membrane protein PorP/SprF [Bacteroidales bacterium]|nr:type IX secretion system membrane protein PorP/SprF [Bacteroidales bacterium]
MKRILTTILSLALVFHIFGQQVPIYSQYMLNPLLINPGTTGGEDFIPLRLTARQQWMGVENGPSTQALSAHMLLNNKNMGVGGYVFADRFGPETKIGVQGNYAYWLDLPGIDSRLSLGIALKAFQYGLDYTKMTQIESDDQTLYENSETTLVPDADFGVYLKNDNYFAGISATQLLQIPINIAGQDIKKNSMVRHYFLYGGYNFKLNNDFNIVPSLMATATEFTAYSVDINIKGVYKKDYWLGVSYRSGNQIVGMIGATYENIVFGYAFDYDLFNMKALKGTHEIMLGYNFGDTKKRGSSLL